jgi:LacI family transcriptional regulator
LPFPPVRGHLSLNWSRFAAVALGYSVWRPNLDRVASHYSNNLVHVVHQLRRLGYHRIGFALQEGLDERTDRNMISSFRFLQQGMGAANRVPVRVIQARGEREFTRWIQDHRPDVVISFGGPVLGWMRELGLRIPERVGFVDLDLSDTTGACAGIDQHSEALAATAVDLLVAQLHRNELGVPTLPKLMLIEGTWIPGATVRPQKP